MVGQGRVFEARIRKVGEGSGMVIMLMLIDGWTNGRDELMKE